MIGFLRQVKMHLNDLRAEAERVKQAEADAKMVEYLEREVLAHRLAVSGRAVVHGYFKPESKGDKSKDEKSLGNTLDIDQLGYIESAREVSIDNLVFLKDTRWFNKNEVFGITDIKGSIIPFYVDKNDFKFLQQVKKARPIQ
jgi:hypothetical protein